MILVHVNKIIFAIRTWHIKALNNFNMPVLKNFLTYAFGAIFLRAITASIAFISILFLNPEQYGLLSLINTFIGVLPIFLNLGLRQAFGLDFFHVDTQERKKILNDIITLYLLLAVPISFLLILKTGLINKYIFLDKANSSTLLIMIGICFFHFFTELFFQTLRYQSKAIQLTTVQIIMGIINAGFAIVFIYFLKLQITGVVLANLLAMIIILFYGLYLYIKKVNFLSFNLIKNKAKAKYYLKLGIPFIPSMLFTWIISFGDRWVLAKYNSLHDVGIYSLADSFGQLYQMLILYPLSGSYLPYIFTKFSTNKNNIIEMDKQNRKNMYISMICMFVSITVLFLITKNIFFWAIPPKFHESINYIWLLLMGQVIFMGSYFATCYLVFLKRTYILVSFTIIAAMLNVILNFILIPHFKIYGCVIATLVSYIIYLILILLVTNQVQKSA